MSRATQATPQAGPASMTIFRRRNLTGPALAALIVIAAAARVPLLAGGQLDYDEGVYWASLRSLSEGHPLFSAVYSSQPPAFLPSLLPFYELLGHSLLAARLGILLFWMVTLIATHETGRALTGRTGALVATALVALDPLMLRQSVALMADGPAMAWGMVAVALAAHHYAGGDRGRCARPTLAGAALAVGMGTKLFDAAFLAPVVLLLVLPPRRGPEAASRGGRHRAAATCAWLAAGFMAAALVMVLPLGDRLPDVWSQSITGHVSARGLPLGGFTADMAAAMVRELPLALLGGTALLLLHRRRSVEAALLAVWIAGAAALLIVQRPLWPHHLIIGVPPLALAAAGLTGLASAPRGRERPAGRHRGMVALLVTGVAALTTTTGALALWGAAARSAAVTAAPMLSAGVPASDAIVSDDPFAVVAASRDTPPELVDTSDVRLPSQPLTVRDIESLIDRRHVRAVFFGSGRFATMPGLRRWVVARFPHTRTLPGGRILYRR
ncbi:MAG: ArnT family glycosyltransferase [Candidatus Dormibacteria bacterium]